MSSSFYGLLARPRSRREDSDQRENCSRSDYLVSDPDDRVSVWKLVIQPARQSAAQHQASVESDRKLQETQGTSKYSKELSIGIDSFSGYAIFRSDEFQNQLSQKGIRFKLVDDQVDYTARAKAIAEGKTQFALFPADCLVKVSSTLSSLPATIIAIVDEREEPTRWSPISLGFQTSIRSTMIIKTRFVLVADSLVKP